VTAHEDHGQFVVHRGIGQGAGFGEVHGQGVELGSEGRGPARPIERQVAGHRVEPPLRMGGHPRVRPPLEGAEQGLLHHLLRHVQVRGPQHPSERGHHAARASPEEMLDEPGNLRVRTRGHGCSGFLRIRGAGGPDRGGPLHHNRSPRSARIRRLPPGSRRRAHR